jgi:hypothetical protein
MGRMESPVSIDGVEWSELDGLENVLATNKNQVALVKSATTKNTRVGRTGPGMLGSQMSSSEGLTDTRRYR